MHSLPEAAVTSDQGRERPGLSRRNRRLTRARGRKERKQPQPRGSALTAGSPHPPSEGGADPLRLDKVPAAPRGRGEQPGRPGILRTKESPRIGTRSRSKFFSLTKALLCNPFSVCPLVWKLHAGTSETPESSPIQTVNRLEQTRLLTLSF